MYDMVIVMSLSFISVLAMYILLIGSPPHILYLLHSLVITVMTEPQQLITQLRLLPIILNADRIPAVLDKCVLRSVETVSQLSTRKA